MSLRIAARVITWVSSVIGIVGFIVFLEFILRRQSPPVWDDALFTYGGVFVVVLFMDFLGKQASRLRGESDVRMRRPAPLPDEISRRQTLQQSGQVEAESVRLDPVQGENVSEYRSLVDEAVTEVSALHGEKPLKDAVGHVTTVPAEQWITSSKTYGFLIYADDVVAGTIVLGCEDDVSTLYLLYVKPEWRRRRVATKAVKDALQFSRMIRLPQPMFVSVSDQNMRARSFLERIGFVHVKNESEQQNDRGVWTFKSGEHR